MTGVALTIDQQDIANINGVIGDFINADTRLLMDTMGEHTLSETLINFDREETPQGQAWTPSRRAAETSGKTLQHKGHLRDSYTYQVSATLLEVGSNWVYAGIHHFGGDTGRNKATHIEARPALGVTPQLERDFQEIYVDWAEGYLN